MTKLRHISVCTYYKPDSREQVEEIFFDLDLSQPDFLPYQDVLVEPSDFKECQYVYSDSESIGDVRVDQNEFELSVQTRDPSENDNDGGDSPSPEEEYDLHFHVNSTRDNIDKFQPIIESVLEKVPNVELNVVASYFEVPVEKSSWDLSGPRPEDATLQTIYLELEPDIQSAIYEYEGGTLITVRQMQEPVFNKDNYFREVNQYIDLHRDYVEEFIP